MTEIQNDYIWLVSADTKACGSPLCLPPAGGFGGYVKRFSNRSQEEKGKKFSHRALRGHRGVGFGGRGVDGLVYTNSQPYSKRA